MATDDGFPEISDYGFISSCRSCALVARDGSIEWACFGRFDARPVFARMLDRDKGGWFRIAPAGPHRTARRYLPSTNVLETTFSGDMGTITVTDCLALRADPDAPGGIAWPAPSDLLIRVVRGVEGSVLVRLEFHPRFDYGLTAPHVSLVAPDLATAVGSADGLVIQSELGAFELGDPVYLSEGIVQPGETKVVTLTALPSHLLQPDRLDRDDLLERVDATVRFWEGWSAETRHDGPYRDQVVRSALVLKGLSNAATGAVAAAATTSLPEEIGGERNWDYRFTWLRGSAAIIGALAATGHLREAGDFGAWLLRTSADRAEDLQIMYGLGGERLLHEARLDHLSGYRGSQPVRIGNGAWNQFQIDIYGELLEALLLTVRLGALAESGDRRRARPEVRMRFVAGVVDRAIELFDEPDEGIWGMRGGRQQYLFSKLMAWVAVDRGLQMAEHFGVGRPQILDRWRRERDRMRERIERDGVDPATGGFTQALGSTALDAAALQVGLRGFLPMDDRRVQATIVAVDGGLTRDGHCYRYRSDDGLRGDEGTFVLCTLWLINSLVRSGRIDEAKRRLDAVLACANDLGLLAEEIQPGTGRQLGNFPHALSHAGSLVLASENGR